MAQKVVGYVRFQVPAGKSDHHTGFGVTLKIYSDSVTSNIYDSPDYYNWFVDNAHKYGFVIRYLIIAIFAIVAFIMRKKIIGILKTLKK